MKLLVVGVLLLVAHGGYTIEFEDCSNAGEVYTVGISDCSEGICMVHIGSITNVTMSFMTKVPAGIINERVFLLINEVEYDVVVRPEACSAFDSPGCPLKKGDVRLYRARFALPSYTPPVKANLIWILKNEKEDLIACFATPIQLSNDRAAGGAWGHPRQRTFRLGTE